MSPLVLWFLMTLAAYRVWRLWAADTLPPIVSAREAVWSATERRFGAEWADGWTCAWCSGTWVALATVALTDLFVSVPLVGLQYPAVAVGVGLIATVVEG